MSKKFTQKSSKKLNKFNFEVKNKDPKEPTVRDNKELTSPVDLVSNNLYNWSIDIASKYFGKSYDKNKEKKRKELYKDPEIYGAIQKRLDRVIECDIEIIGATAEDEKALMAQLRKNDNLENLKKWAVEPIFSQYKVVENLWEVDEAGNYSLKKFIEMPNEFFEPYDDGVNVVRTDISPSKIAPFGKYILSVHNGNVDNRWGESVLDPLVGLLNIRNNIHFFWMKWLERFGMGFLEGTVQKNASAQEMQEYKNALEKAMQGTTIIHGNSLELEFHQTNGSGEQFERFNNAIIDCFNRLILGETSTSRISERGSTASTVTHAEQGLRRARNDAKLIKKAVDRFIYQYWVINGKDLNNLPYVEIYFDTGINLERARRDYLLTQMNDRLIMTKSYLMREYGFRESDLDELEVSPSAQTGNQQTSNQADIDNSEGTGGSPDTRKALNKEIEKIVFGPDVVM